MGALNDTDLSDSKIKGGYEWEAVTWVGCSDGTIQYMHMGRASGMSTRKINSSKTSIIPSRDGPVK